MEKLLHLYKYVDGVNDSPFPSKVQQAILYKFKYDAKRMGNVPTITGTLMYPQCLDNEWGNGLVYVTYNGERYFLRQTPTSSYSNEDTRYKHEVDFVSERIVLNDVYFYDVVASDVSNDKPVSNSSNVTFFGDIHEFAQRLNYSLQYANVGYSVVVDEGITSEGKLVSFQDQFFANALQEIYNTYEIPYYFVGKVIHIGYTNNAITHTFKYGVNDALLSIQKTNANYKITNRVTGIGSADNIPYYYPNKDEKGSSKALYNNSSSNITIENESLYKKVKLSDVFTYTNIAKYTHTITNGEQYSFENELTETSANIWELWQVYYPFTIDKISEYVDFDIDYTGSDFRFINIELWNGGQRIATYNKRGKFTRKCGLGDYEFRIGLGIYSEEHLPKSYADTIISKIKVSATQEIESEIGWYLNDKRYTIVQLSDYGLKVSTTPKDGDKITFEQIGYIKPQMNLMPPIYRESNGSERFYNALNETYISPQTSEYYTFDNPYVEGKPKEHIVTFDDIKPSIVGITNASGQRIDMFSEFAYDANDNDEFDEEGNYLHPYFFGKLRKFDGAYGFNLFDHAIEEDEMVISMTSGSCGACNFIIGVDEETQKNIVQVDENGKLLRDANGNVLFGSPQERQNDTSKYEVWVALKKDIDTFGVIMPNASGNYKPKAGDTFVILHIDLPYGYIVAAEDRLKEQIIKYMAMNNSEKFTFSITFSRIFFAENPTILAQLDENARLQIEYNGKEYELYVSSYSYSMNNDNPLPEIRVELSDTLTISQNALQNAISEVKGDIMSSVGSIDWARIGLKYFLRKDVDDRAKGKIASDTAIEVGKFVSGASGAIIYVDKTTGQTIAELDKLYVRMKAYFEQLEIVNVNSVGGKQILSPAGALRISNVVDNGGDYYRCYFLNEQDGEEIENRFVVGDQAYCQLFNAKSGVLNNISNKYYWRLVVGVGKDYIDLSKNDCDSGSDVPSVGDVVCHKGNRNDVDRQNLIEFSSVDSYSPSIILYQGVNSYSLSGKDLVSFGVDKTTNKAFMNVYGDMYVGDRNNTSYMRYTQENGLELKGRLAIGTTLSDGRNLEEAINNAGGVDYLKEALKESTTVDGGLVQTSLLMLGYTENGIFNVMSGTNGLYKSSEKGGGIAAWYGGPMADKEADNTLVAFAQSLFRFDGSGYLAGGNISWDKDGAGSVAGGDIKWDKDGIITLGIGVKISGDENETLGTILNSINRFYSWFAEDKDGNVYVRKNGDKPRSFYAYGDIFAGGIGTEGPTASGIIQQVYGASAFGGTFDSSNLTDTFNAHAINSLYTTIQRGVKNPYALTINGTSYDGSSAVDITISGGGGVADSIDWTNVYNKPTTLGGYGITDALSASGGRINGTNQTPLIINTSATNEVGASYAMGLISKAWVGYNPYNGAILYNYACAKVLGLKDDGTPHYNGNTLIHSGNIGSYNAGSATKLQTARTIWGQSFDGSGDVWGTITVKANAGFYHYTTDGFARTYIGYDSSIEGSHIYNFGNGNSIQVLNDGRVVVPKGNFQVNGEVKLSSNIDNGACLLINQEKTTASYNAIEFATNGTSWGFIHAFDNDFGGYAHTIKNLNIYSEIVTLGTWTNPALTVKSSTGNVLIGTTTDNGYKLQVYGGATYASDVNVYDINGIKTRLTQYTYNNIGRIYVYNETAAAYSEMRIGRDTPEGIVIQSNGNVLIGEPNDNGTKFQVNGAISATYSQFSHTTPIRFTATGTGIYNIATIESSSTGFIIERARKSDSASADIIPFIISQRGGGEALKLDGNNLTVAGDITAGSDARYKSKLQDIAIDVKTIAEAPLFNYKWNDREDNNVHLGTTAQYWMDTNFKDAVNANNPDFYHLNYGALGVAIGITVAKKVVNHEERISALEKENKELKEELKQYRRA